MTDLLLIHPGATHGIYGSDLAKSLVAVEQPFWCRLIAGAMINRGWSVSILDAEAEALNSTDCVDRIAVVAPRLIGIVVSGHQPSASTQQMIGAGKIAKAIKEAGNGVPIVMLGNHPSALPVQTLKDEHVDFVIDGEGPLSLDGLLRNAPLATIPGLVWWDDDIQVQRNPLAPLLDIDKDLDGGSWKLLDMSLYRSHNWQRFGALDKRQPYAAIHTSLGCSYKCTFCLREGTLIVTKKGLNKNIEKLKKGDELLAWDEEKNKIVETTIIETASRTVDKLIRIVTSSGEVVEATSEHPLFTERGWVEAGSLREDDRILVMERKDKVKYLRAKYPHPITEAGRKRISKRMSENNPMKQPEVALKVGKTMKERHGERMSADLTARHAAGKMPHGLMSEEAIAESSIRMKKNNPMKNPETVEKVVKKRAALRKSGDFVPFMCTERGRKIISEKARERALSDDNPMKNPDVVQNPEFRAKRSANMLGRWADPEQAAQLMAIKKYGPEHHLWKGGLSNQPYPLAFNLRLKRKIRERDGNVCQNCGGVDRLGVHHIDYIKENLDECNLLTLCVGCNAKANFNRPVWQKRYTEMMMVRGECPHFEFIVKIEEIRGSFRVFNFECAPYNNYWAGFILSHNCMINVFQHTNRYRMRDPKAVVNEMVILNREYGVETFKFVDELFVLNRRHCEAICNGLIEAGLGDRISTWCYSRTDTFDPAMLPLFRRAGFDWFALGIESGSQRVRADANKSLKNDSQIVETVRAIEKAGINVISNFIFGLPDDDLESMQETLDLALSLNTSFANFYVCMAYPGSQLYDEAVAKNWTLPSTWSGYSQHNSDCRPLDTKYADAATVLRFRDEAFNTYFTNPRYLEMVERKFGRETLEHVKGMTTYKLKRKLLEAAT